MATIGHIHHIMNNKGLGNVYTSAKRDANPTWFRLQVLTHNLLQLIKMVAYFMITSLPNQNG